MAVTSAVWADIEDIPKSKRFQSVEGRLWDVLSMLFFNIRLGNLDGDTLNYRITMHVGIGTYYYLKAVVHGGDNGEPVITIMKPSED